MNNDIEKLIDSLVWGPEWHYETSKGELNFNGAARKHFKQINLPKLKDPDSVIQYYKNYINNIFRCVNPNIPVTKYDNMLIGQLLERIQMINHFDDSTMESRIRHLIYDPIDKELKLHPEISNPLWGSSYAFEKKNGANAEAALLLIPKSLTDEQNKTGCNYLISNPEADGEIIGLALMYSIGTRENETCGANFGDIHELNNFPGIHYIFVGYETTMINSSQLKAGGKTWNAPRRLILHPTIYEFLMERRAYIEQEIGSNADLYPIACRGKGFHKRCSSNNLAAAGKVFLKDVIKFNEYNMSGTSYEFEKKLANGEDVGEADATTYILRRNLATLLYILGFTRPQYQYFMGHLIEDDMENRKDYADENLLYGIYQKLLKHPYLTTAQNKKEV